MPVVLSRSDHPVASVLHTEEVTGSNPVSPTQASGTITPISSTVGPPLPD